MKRRHFLVSGALPLLGCAHPDDIGGGFTGIQHERGHLLRDARQWPTPAVTRTTNVLIAGGGVAGLAATRALRLRGMEDFALLELEDEAGGNSRSGSIQGLPCPLGAHYLPLPGDDAPEVQDLLEELGLRSRVAGRWQYDERHLCHSPQERLYFNGVWQDGLLPVQGVGASTLAQYQKFAALVAQLRQAARWTMPMANRPLAPVQRALAATTFVAYLNSNGLNDRHLRWYLDYCCRDDYGAGIGTVSAWAGIHYFASRHGFHAPGLATEEREGLLTWPEGNAWLTRRLAAPLGERLHTGQLVLRITNTKHGVELDAFNTATQTVERWQARSAIVALPVFVAAKVVQDAPDFLRQAASRTVYAPWLVANIHIRSALNDRPGAAPSWDNVLYDPGASALGGVSDSAAGAGASPGTGEGAVASSTGLGYVDAMHQSLRPVAGATVLTHYRALGDWGLRASGGAGAVGSALVPTEAVPGVAGRRLLMNTPWSAWRDQIVNELATAHPDLPAKTTRIDITRYGHAMAIPVPINLSQTSLQPPWNVRKQLLKKEQTPLTHGRLRFAHSDWAGYSVFEEAFTLGHGAGSTAY